MISVIGSIFIKSYDSYEHLTRRLFELLIVTSWMIIINETALRYHNVRKPL